MNKEWDKLKNQPAWDERRAKPKAAEVRRAKQEGKTTHFANLVDLCHLKNAELARHHQKYEGRVVLWGDTVKGGCAFEEALA